MYDDFPPKCQVEKKPKIIPFKAHFQSRVIPGKSYVRTGLPKTHHTVTEKFYRKERYELPADKVDEICEKLKTIGPREKYEECVTENQKYGWHHDVKLTNLDKNDSRLHFAQKMDHFLKLYLITNRK